METNLDVQKSFLEVAELLADALTRLFTPDAPDGNAPAAANARGA
jgi:hypothetical protein